VRLYVLITAAPPARPRNTLMLANDTFHIAVLPGDGIGIEVMRPAL
jgi:hypothetical protein